VPQVRPWGDASFSEKKLGKFPKPAWRVVRGQLGRLGAGLGKAVTRVRSVIVKCTPVITWIEDRAEVLVKVFVSLAVCTLTMLLLWKWAKVIHFAQQITAVLTLVILITSAAAAGLRWLQKRRDKRTKPPARPPNKNTTTGLDGFSLTPDHLDVGPEQPDDVSMMPPTGAHG
jgi:hypothetical protein